jgi:hypothetical protein
MTEVTPLLNGSGEKLVTPLPRLPMAILALAIFSEPVSSTILLPFIYFMVRFIDCFVGDVTTTCIFKVDITFCNSAFDLTLLSMYCTLQVRDFHVAEDEKSIGFYAGEPCENST